MVTMCHPVQADLLSYWPLDDGAGSVAQNLGTGPNGQIFFDATGGLGAGGNTWMTDPVRGTVLSFNGDNGAGTYVDGGDIPALGLTDDFTWVFWSNQDGDGTGVNEVVLGNRYNRNGVDDNPRQFIKFTPTKFEYHVANGQDVEYDDLVMNQGEWIHHAVVKNGDTLTYFRNGVQNNQRTAITHVHNLSHPFYIGGDVVGERWRGMIDEVAIWDEALIDADIATIFTSGVDALLGPPPVPGDVNGDEVVDLFDYEIIRDKFQTGITREEGNLDRRGFTDLADFRIWKNAFEAQPAPVPEPAGLLLAATALLLAASARRH